MNNLLRVSLQCARTYSDAWINAVGTPHNRTRLLCDLGVCLVTHMVAINLFRQLLDTEPGYEAPADYPMSNPSSTLRCWWLLWHFPSSITAIANAATSSRPAEVIILGLHIRAAATALLAVSAPSLFLRWRSYVHLLGSLFTHVIMYASLVTHPHCAPSQSLTAYVTNPAVGLVTQQIMCNLEPVPGLIHVFIGVLLGVAGFIYVPKVYPDIQISSTAPPILTACAVVCACIHLRRRNSQQAQVEQRPPLTLPLLQKHNQQILHEQQLQQEGCASTTCMLSENKSWVPDDACRKSAAVTQPRTDIVSGLCAAQGTELPESESADPGAHRQQVQDPFAREDQQHPYRPSISAPQNLIPTQAVAQGLIGTLGANTWSRPLDPIHTITTTMYGISVEQLPSNFLRQLSHSLTTGPRPHHMIMSAAVREDGCDTQLTVDLMQIQDS